MKLARLLPAFAAGAVLTACGGGGTTTTTNVTVPSDLSISSVTADFSYLSKLKDLTAAGKGSVAVILPDTTSSVRYVQFDQPYLQKAFEQAGYKSSDFSISNAQGQEAQELALAQAAITKGATVLIMDPLNSTVGSQIQSYAQSKGVKVISYDRATFTGTNTYYVSFDNVQVGELIGKGFVQCVSDWGVKSPQVFELHGGQNADPSAARSTRPCTSRRRRPSRWRRFCARARPRLRPWSTARPRPRRVSQAPSSRPFCWCRSGSTRRT